MINWIREWVETWRVLRAMDAETRAFLTGPLDPDDFVEAERP